MPTRTMVHSRRIDPTENNTWAIRHNVCSLRLWRAVSVRE